MSVLAEVPPRPTTVGFVFDYQNVIDDEIEQEINNFSFELQRLGIMELFILTVPTIGDLEPYEYGVQLFRQWGIGDKEKNNGMVIFATTDMGEKNNIVRIATGYGLEGDYPDGYTGELLDNYMIPSLEEGDYTTAFAKVIEAIREKEGVAYEWQQAEVFEQAPLTWLEISLIVAMVTAFLGFFSYLLYQAFRTVQRIFYNLFEKITGKDIRSKRYKAYLLKQQEKIARRQARRAASYPTSEYYSSYDSDSNNSYSGGGGDSGGGGSDRSF